MANITLKGNPIKTIGDLPKIGQTAPNFDGVSKDLSSINNDELKGKNIILNIFPSIDTGVCATSTQQFNQLANSLKDTVVLCASLDLPFALNRFCTTENLENVTPVSMYRSSFGEDYGLTIIDGPLKGLLSRAVVVIDKEGIISYTEQVPEIAQEPNYNAALAACNS